MSKGVTSISSPTNPHIKRVVRLADRRARDGARQTVVEGVREVSRAHAAQAVVVGTYAVSSRQVFVSLKLVRPEGNLTIAAHDYALVLDETALAQLAAPECLDLVSLAADKLAVQAWRLPPGARATALDPAGSSGQFFMVVGGSLLQGGQALGLWETVFVSPDEPALVMQAGPSGAQLLLMQSPPRAPEYSAIS